MRLVLDARTASFAALIDYAGLFPPASLDMDEAASVYRKARESQVRWVAGRFLCHASRLETLAGVLTRTFTHGDEPWEIGVIFDIPSGQAASQAQNFHSEMQPAAIVAAAEARIVDPSPAAVGGLVDSIISVQPDIVPYLEVIPTLSMTDQLAVVGGALRDRGRIGGVKLRSGGLSASDFPDPSTVASFILAATNASVPFKATAGLHQPIRHYDPGLDVWRHGFINLLIASAAAASGHTMPRLMDIIGETDPDAFSIGAAFATWRNVSIPGPEMRRVRSQGFVSYGSCDFFEPIEALRDLSYLGEGT